MYTTIPIHLACDRGIPIQAWLKTLGIVRDPVAHQVRAADVWTISDGGE